MKKFLLISLAVILMSGLAFSASAEEAPAQVLQELTTPPPEELANNLLQTVLLAQAPNAPCSFPLLSGWCTSGTRRGMTTVNFSKIFIYSAGQRKKVTITYNVNVISQKKKLWGLGKWDYAPCPNECWISGTWTIVFDYMDPVTLAYWYSKSYTCSYSYPHPNCINKFNASINPTTGGTAPYPSSFTFTAPTGAAFLDVYISSVQWNVYVPGGSSGINCSVHCP